MKSRRTDGAVRPNCPAEGAGPDPTARLVTLPVAVLREEGLVVSFTFQVDLHGVVDLLSRHLYASPRVYIRELLQNSVDAVAARGVDSGGPPGEIWIEPLESTGDGTLRVHDAGIGLTEAQVHQLLATIGRSSKRDELGFARHEFLGQFGIGLLSCFMVAEEVRVLTRCGDAPSVVWTGFADGRYDVRLLTAEQQRPEPGTTVTLLPRKDAEHWLSAGTVTQLAALYGSMLPVRVRVGETVVTSEPAPWEAPASESAVERRDRRIAHAQDVFGFTPFDLIDLSVPEAGLRAVAYVLPAPSNPAARATHRVYLKRMLLSEGVEDLLPPWAFFVRCVVDTSELRPTASREALYEDALLDHVREVLGDRLRGWIGGLGSSDPDRLSAFLRIHQLGVKALAVHDDEMLRLVEQWVPFETTLGQLTLAEFRELTGSVRWTSTVEEFRQLAPVAAAQSIPVLNGGYAFDADLITRLPDLDGNLTVEVMSASDLVGRLDQLEPAVELSLRPFLSVVQRGLDRRGVEVVVRAFDPVSLPALHLVDVDIALRGDLRRGQAQVDEFWSSVLQLYTAGRDMRPQLVLNYRNQLVRQLAATADEQLVILAVEGLYAQALLLSHQPLQPQDRAALNQSFLGLLERAMGGRS